MGLSPTSRAHAALATAAVFAAFAALSIGAVFAASPPDPMARERASLQAVCAKCHNLQIVMDTPMSYEGWHDTVQKMIDRGADGTDDQLADIMDYLHRTMTTLDVNSADADELAIVLGAPEPVVKAIVARRTARKFKNLDELKTVPGIDAASVDAKARLLFFQ
jgi:hypothetical protein